MNDPKTTAQGIWEELAKLPTFVRKPYNPPWRGAGYIGVIPKAEEYEIFSSGLYNLATGLTVVLGSELESKLLTHTPKAKNEIHLFAVGQIGSLHEHPNILRSEEEMTRFLQIQQKLSNLVT